MRWVRRWSGWLPRHLGHVVDVDVTDSSAQASRRRRVVSAVHLIGTGLLGASLSTRPGSGRFYTLTFSTAATWIVGSLLSGPLHRGWIENRARQLNRPVAVPVATGVAAFVAFCGGALVVRRIPLLHRAVSGALVFAERGRGPWVLLTTCANGIGEEVFFRGAMYAALPGTDPVLSSTAVYTLTTTATRNPALILAAGLMGTLFGYQRRATQGLQAPLLTHLTWSTLMVTLLPRISRWAEPDRAGPREHPTRPVRPSRRHLGPVSKASRDVPAAADAVVALPSGRPPPAVSGTAAARSGRPGACRAAHRSPPAEIGEFLQ